MKHAFMVGVFYIQDLIDKVQRAWFNGAIKVANFMGDMKANVLMILQNMVNGAIDILNDFISTLNQIPGVEIELIEHLTFGTTAALENEAKKQARNQVLDEFNKTIDERISGRKAALEAHSEMIMADYNSRQMEIDALRVQNSLTGYHEPLGGTDSDTPILEQIAGNTGAMKDALEVSSEHLKYVRELAEQGTINRFVLAELKVEQNNNISAEEENIYGLSDRLKDELLELMEITARGV